MPNDFAHLRAHTEYSVQDSIIRVGELADACASRNVAACAVTDLMNMFGLIRCYVAFRAKGVKPLIAVDANIDLRRGGESGPVGAARPGGQGGGPSPRVALIASTLDGYHKLTVWQTEAYEKRLTDANANVAIDSAWIERDGSEGVICLSGGPYGPIGIAAAAGDRDGAKRDAELLSKLFPGRFYLEVMRLKPAARLLEEVRAQPQSNISELYLELASHPGVERIERRFRLSEAEALRLSSEMALPLAATHPALFMQPLDYVAHEVRACIASKDILRDRNRARLYHPGQYFVDAAGMAELFADLPDALENARQIGLRCNVEIELGVNHLPFFDTGDEGLVNQLRRRAREGLEERLKAIFPDEADRAEHRKIYDERLAYELGVIEKMDFPGYFLIVADFINWAKNNGCPVGPGRGSGAGSLVAYSLRITNLNPMPYNLLFERFLNPERVSMPDFDVDFCPKNRYRVIDYVRSKYGEKAVGQILTFGKMSSKAVVRDVGRVLGLPYGFCDRISKLVPRDGQKNVPLKDALVAEPEIMRRAKEERAEILIDLSLKIEDITRGVGVHAAGVVISPGVLTDFCPVYVSVDSEASSVSMFDKNDVEQAGLVKFDFLGLRNLTTIKECLDFVRERTGREIDLDNMPFDDPKVYELLGNGDTIGVFQFESEGMVDMLKKARPKKFEDLIGFISLYRPGPMKNIPEFIRRMRGKPIEYLHPMLKRHLEETYGIFVYQEQVMEVARTMANYTLGAADELRRAMGKKKQKEMKRHRKIFIDGALKNGVGEDVATAVFDNMEAFAAYGFNKSHAACYAMVAYQTAYLKLYYPAEYFSSAMSATDGNSALIKDLVMDARRIGMPILPPDVNASGFAFRPEGERSVRFGFSGVKGVGEAFADSMEEERKARGPFLDLADFSKRMADRGLRKNALESLVKCGAFDRLDPDRAKLFATIDVAVRYGAQVLGNAGQSSLFDEDDSASVMPMAKARPWTLAERMGAERSVLGFYLTDHPVREYAGQIESLRCEKLASLELSPDKALVAGIVTDVFSKFSAKKDKDKDKGKDKAGSNASAQGGAKPAANAQSGLVKRYYCRLEDETGEIMVSLPERVAPDPETQLPVGSCAVFLLDLTDANAFKSDDDENRSEDDAKWESNVVQLRCRAFKLMSLQDARSDIGLELKIRLKPGADSAARFARYAQSKGFAAAQGAAGESGAGEGADSDVKSSLIVSYKAGEADGDLVVAPALLTDDFIDGLAGRDEVESYEFLPY